MVEETIDGKRTLNQPAGHLEDGESLIEAIIRETQEETAWQFVPSALVGIYRWQQPDNEATYIRFCFTGSVHNFDATQSLDADIDQALWLTQQQLMERQLEFRSPLVDACLNDYLAGQRYPLTLLHN